MIELTLTPNKQQAQIQCDSETLNLIREGFSAPNPAFGRRGRFIPKRLYSITPSGKFEIGMMGDLVKFMHEMQYVFKVSEELKKYYKCGFDDIELCDLSLKFRDYQELSIRAAIKQGRGITIIPTAGGKTLICAGLIETLRKCMNDPDALVLVIVPSIQLVEQTASDFCQYGLKNVSKWSGDNKLNPDSKIIVAGTQLLMSEKTDLSILSEVKLLLIDECLRKNTLISTDRGLKKIQNIQIGDMVKSYNVENNIIEYKPVLNTWKNLYKSNSYQYFLKIELENGNIIQVTPNHKVYTQRGYVRADELTHDDDIVSIDSTKTMNLRCKYLYAKTNIETHLHDMRRVIKISWKTFKIQTPGIYITSVLRQIFKKIRGWNLRNV